MSHSGTPGEEGAQTRTSWTGPSWLGPGFAFIGNWEPLVFRRRRGGLRTDELERYEREHSPEALREMQALGITLVVMPFDKGFGASAQAFDFEQSLAWSRDLHAAGIKVGTYIRYDNIVPETISQDVPDYRDWVAHNGEGQGAAILNQSYRLAAQPTHEDHLAYVDSLIVKAIDELQTDLIHMDGFWMQNVVSGDTSPRTVAAFRAFLRGRYPDPEVATDRFGHNRLEMVEPPSFREPDMGIDAFMKVTDPVIQEWLIFRAHLTTSLAERFSRVTKEAAAARGREVAYTANTLIPIGYSNGLYWGFEVDKTGPYLDAQWTEDDHWAELRADGVLVSRIREFKIGATAGTRVFSYQRAESERQLQVSMAQALAFNDGVVGMLGSPHVAFEKHYEAKRDMMRWISSNVETLAGNSSAADVAILRSPRSLMFEAAVAHRNVILAELMLIQGKVAFDIVFDEVFDHLDRYKVLVLADAVCLSDAQLEAVRGFVSQGGALVATGRTSMYNEWYRLRPTPGLADLFGPQVAYDEGDNWKAPSTSLLPGLRFAEHEFGRGRAAFIPTIDTDVPPHYSGVLGERPYRFGTEEWQVPSTMRAFLDAIAWARGGVAPLSVDAPQGVAVDLQTGADGATVVHLVDYALHRDGAVLAKIAVHAPGASSARVHAWGEEPVSVPFAVEGAVITLEVPVNVYAAVVLR